jgi:Family of unknown function (DUF6655)
MHGNCTFAQTARMIAVLVVVATLLAGGCTTVKMTGTSRSGSEQLLLTGAWDLALCRVDFSPLAGSKVYLDPERITVVDKDWIITTIRRTMAEQGIALENDKKKAQVILEVALGAYGTDERNTKAGLPSVGLVPSLAGASVVSSGSSSSLTLSEKNHQDAVVKALMFAYETKTGHLVWESGPMLDAEGLRDHFFCSSGPYRVSSLPEVENYPTEAQSHTRKRLWHRVIGQ